MYPVFEVVSIMRERSCLMAVRQCNHICRVSDTLGLLIYQLHHISSVRKNSMIKAGNEKVDDDCFTPFFCCNGS